MARVQTSAIITDIRGKVKGSVFQSGQGGLIIRSNPAPLNPNSISQSRAKRISFLLQQAWKDLTNAQRAAWANFAVYNPIGQKNNPNRGLTGQQVFIKLHTYRLSYGGSIMPNPVFQPPANVPFIGTLTKTFGAITFIVDRIPVIGVQYIILFASYTVPDTVNSPGNRMKLIIFPTQAALNQIITTQYTAVFGNAPISGGKLFYKYATGDSATNLISSFTLGSSVYP